MSMDPLFKVRWKEHDDALEELRERSKVEQDEWQRKLDAEQLEHSEWIRRFDAGAEEASRKYDAELEELKKKRDADGEPFQMNQISVCSIPSVPVQKVILLQVAQKRIALKVLRYF